MTKRQLFEKSDIWFPLCHQNGGNRRHVLQSPQSPQGDERKTAIL